MRETVIVEAVRTRSASATADCPSMHAADLSAARAQRTGRTHRASTRRSSTTSSGAACRQVGDQSSNIGRYSVLAAGWPEHIPGTTVNRACGSSQQALDFAVQAVMSGQQDVVVAGGVEVMSRVPLGSARATGMPYGPKVLARYDGFLVQPGHLRGDDRQEVGLLPHPARRVLGAVARARGGRAGRGAVQRPDRRRCSPTGSAVGADEGIRRGTTRREARRTQAGVHRRRGDPRGQLVADLRRRRGAAGDDRGERASRWA